MTECPDCPYRLWPVRCHAAAVGSRRLCELARTRPDYRAALHARTLDAPVPTSDPRGPEARALMAALAARRRCPCHTPPSCGCDDVGQCSRPDRPLWVAARACLDCLARADWSPP